MWGPGACVILRQTRATWSYYGADDIDLNELSDFKVIGVKVGARAMIKNRDQSETECKTRTKHRTLKSNNSQRIPREREAHEGNWDETSRELKIKPKESEVNFELHFQKYELNHARQGK